jgi:hypothetical protein
MDTKTYLEKRIAELEAEGQRVATEAAEKALIPYRAAIGELRGVLALTNAPQGDASPPPLDGERTTA